MGVEVVTKEDLTEFREQLLTDIKALLIPKLAKPVKEWLKSSEVCKLLGISSGKLQSLRIAGKLRSAKIGGVHYYKYVEIEKLLESSMR